MSASGRDDVTVGTVDPRRYVAAGAAWFGWSSIQQVRARVLAVRHDGPDVWVTAVSVERVTGRVRGRQVGPTYRGEMIAGRCEVPHQVGAHVVVLLGVTDMGAPWGDDPYFVIGSTVSASQAAQIGGVPPTATAAPMAPVQPGNPAVPLAIVAGLSFMAILRLLSRRTGRRASRSS